MSKPASPLSIAICAFNSVEYTKLLVASIRNHSIYQHEIVIYSDGSSDDTLAWLRNQSDLTWRHDRKNRGICTAMNRAAQMATREYLFFPNTDHVLAPGWDSALLRHLAPRKVVSSQCIEPGTVPVATIFHARNCGTRFDQFDEAKFVEAAAQLARDQETPGINYPFVISKALWEEVGGLDERFNPGPANDPDLFYRLTLLGAEMVRAEDVIIYHFSGKSSRMAGEARQENVEWHRITDRNEARFEEKWGERYRYANGGLPDPGPEARQRWDFQKAQGRSVTVRSPLKIAIDARSGGVKGGGIREYTVNLARALARLEDRPEVHCLSTEAEALRKDVQAGENLHVHQAPPHNRNDEDDRGLERILEERGCSVFHGPAFCVPPWVKLPSVVTIHDVAFLLLPDAYPPAFRQHLKTVMEDSLRRARRTIVVSDRTRHDLGSFYPWVLPRTVRIYEGLPTDSSTPSEPELVSEIKAQWSKDSDFILSVGVQQKRKNAAGLVRAFGALDADLQATLKLVLVGGAECEDPALEQEIVRLRLSDRVVRTPHLPRNHVSALYRSCRLFVYPSLYEGFGIPPLEAMAHGRPVVCSDGGSLKEVVGEAALVCPAGDESALSDAIRAVATDPRLQEQLITKGKERVGVFSWDKAARETMDAYLKARESNTISVSAPRDAGLEPGRLPSLASPPAISFPGKGFRPRIALDARLLGHRSLGTGRYTTEILRALLTSGGDIELVIIGPKTLDLASLPNADRIIQHVPADTDTLLDAAWEQFSLPSHLLGCDLYFAPTGILPAARPCKGVTVIHDVGFEDQPQYYDARLRSYLAKWIRHSCLSADRVITVSSFTRDRVSSLYGIPSQRLSVVYHGRPEHRALDGGRGGDTGGRDPGRKVTDEYVLAVSSFEPNKNLGTLVSAFGQIRSAWPGRLIMAGRAGRDLPQLRETVQESPSADRIRIIENPDDAEVDQLLREARLFVYPSLYEGFGIPLLEAMTAGLPVIARRGTSCPEVLADAGILIDDMTPQNLADAMAAVLRDAEESKRLSDRALSRSREFSWSKAGQETWDVLKSCLEAR
jgi:glycosyltransferase involved in cell wall biosynthesis/GT2 family glycosyltransferase